MIRSTSRRTYAAAMVALLTISIHANAATWYVDRNGPANADGTSWATAFRTIQEGINAASDGDTVEILSNMYMGPGNRDIDFLGKAITVMNSPTSTSGVIIFCQSGGRGFLFRNGEGPDSQLIDVGIAAGLADDNSEYGPYGGAIYCDNASPTLINCNLSTCVVSSIEDDARGGGLYCNASSPSLTNCQLIYNSAEGPSGWGGAIMNENGSNPRLTGCTISNNSATSGGAVYNSSSSPEFLQCQINHNTADVSGAAMVNDLSAPTLSDCYFVANTRKTNDALLNGGGVYNTESDAVFIRCYFMDNEARLGAGMSNDYSDPILQNCLFMNNVANAQQDVLGWYVVGGGMSNYQSNPSLTNCLFDSNIATSSENNATGGGVYNTYSDPVFTNCTLRNNSADMEAGGMQNVHSTTAIVNSIFWDNSPVSFYHTDPPGTYMTFPSISYSNIENSSGESWFGTGCIDTDPLFAGPDTPILSTVSPCIDAGNNYAVPADSQDLDGDENLIEPLPLDLAGEIRFVDNPNVPDTGNGSSRIVDMGAFESQIYALMDLDDDLDVDLDDYALFADCLAGPNVTTPPAGVDPAVFAKADLDGDDDVDFHDFAIFQHQF